MIKDYVKESTIGHGQFGKVYKVHHKDDTNKLYALKKIKFQNIPYLENAIKREIQIMKKIENENSVKLYESFDLNDYHYLLLELCDGDLEKELEKRLKETNHSYNELEVYMIFTQLNNCFEKMVSGDEEVVHRDLKLANIMVKYDKNIPIIGFVVKLSDFGLSKVMSKGALTQTNVGTPLTKAPEVFFKKKYTSKADLWSIGIIMYQLLYNKTIPFKANEIDDLQNQIKMFKKFSVPEDINNPISNECFDLLNKLLVISPEKRINFQDYFAHKFFSIEHKNELMKKYGNLSQEKIENENCITIISLDNEEFLKKFKKIRLLKEYEGYKIYKARDQLNKNIVCLKEISKDIIDKNEENKNIYNKEIKLLLSLKELNFPKCFGIYETNISYNIILEYFNGNILYDFIIRRKRRLNEALKKDLILQLYPTIMELKKKNIKLNINSKNLAFSYYQNENNFIIKLFDYNLNSIFDKNKDDELFNLTNDNLKDIENNKDNENIQNNSTLKVKPIIKDESIENILDIMKTKIDFIFEYFDELFNDKNILETEILSNYYKEIIILLYFTLLECKLIIKFLNINADQNLNDIDKSFQEIHLMKLYLKEQNKFDYSNINFLDDNTIWYYNKENPLFEYYINIFHNLKNKLNTILDKYIEDNMNNFRPLKNDFNDNNNNETNLEFIKKIIEKCIKEGNLEKLFIKFFENSISIYTTQQKNKIYKELNIVKYILEYIIFLKIISPKETSNLEQFTQIVDNLKYNISFVTFIGNRIKYYKEKNYLNNGLNEYLNEEDVENIETKDKIVLEKFINFYVKIIKLTL